MTKECRNRQYILRTAGTVLLALLILAPLHAHKAVLKTDLQLALSFPALSVGEAQTAEVTAEHTDTLHIYFPVGQSAVLPSFRNNANTLSAIISTLLHFQHTEDGWQEKLSIVISGNASLEGDVNFNTRLARQRAEALKAYIIRYAEVPEGCFELRNEFTGRDNGKNLSREELRYASYMPTFRVVEVAEEPRPAGGEATADGEQATPEPPQPQPQPQPQPVAQQQEREPELPPAKEQPRDYRIAVKTNLLFDAALAPNIEVERWFGRHNHWSAMAEVWFPWYEAHHNSRAYEVLTIGAELRYWMFPHNGNLRPLHGQFVGIYGAGGKYDIEWNSNGNQGEFTSIGLSYGYAFRLARNFNMELSLSGGYMGGPYRHYHGMFGDTHLIWQRTEHRSYWGLTKAKVSLVWLL